MISYHIITASLEQLEEIKEFTDFWISGRGMKLKVQGAVNDTFISPRQHKKYIQKYTVKLLYDRTKLIGWAVIQTDGALIHFLISGKHRRQGIGSKFLKKIGPRSIRSKSDQSSGNPAGFYTKNGYTLTSSIQSKSRFDINKIRPNRPKNIDIFIQKVHPCPNG